MSDQIKFNSTCDGCVEVAVSVAAGAPTVTVVDTNRTLGTVTAGNTGTFNDYLWNGNSTTVSIPDGSTVASGKITGTIKYTNCPTPTATPASTPAPTPTPTPSPTSAGANITGGADCANAVNWPAYGISNKYKINVTATKQWFNLDDPSIRAIYMTVPTGSLNITYDVSNSGLFEGQCEVLQDSPENETALSLGVANNRSYGGFAISTGMGTLSGVFDIWIV
jgi:hypothetical protein